MSLDQVGEALSTVASFLAGQPEAEQAVRARWRAGARAVAGELPAEVTQAADALNATLPSLTLGLVLYGEYTLIVRSAMLGKGS